MRTWMRWSVCAAGVGLGLLPGTVRAEEAVVERRTLLMLQPIYGSAGTVAASVEHALSSHVTLAGTVQATLYLDNNDNVNTTGGDFTTNRWGVGIDPGVHFYLTGHAPEGFWVGPHVEVSVLHHTTRVMVTPLGPGSGEAVPVESGWRTLQYGGSLRAGYTAIVSPGLSVQVGLGLEVLGSRTTPIQGENPAGVPTGSLSEQRTVSFAPGMTLGVGWAL